MKTSTPPNKANDEEQAKDPNDSIPAETRLRLALDYQTALVAESAFKHKMAEIIDQNPELKAQRDRMLAAKQQVERRLAAMLTEAGFDPKDWTFQADGLMNTTATFYRTLPDQEPAQ